MTYPQDFNQKYAYILVYEGHIYTRAHDVPTRSKYDDNGDWSEVPQHTPAELFNALTNFFHAQYGPDNFTHYLGTLGFERPTIITYIQQQQGQPFNPAELSADFHHVRRFEHAYQHSRDLDARKTYAATIPPPPAAVRRQFVKLTALKAQPENNKALNHQREHALINSLIETLHECTQISHNLNRLGDLDIKYTRKDGNTGEAYLPHYNSDNFTPLFINTLNNLLNKCQATRH